jgi:serine/threonine protein kinase
VQVRGKLTRERTLEKIMRETSMLQRLQGSAGVIRLLECFEDEHSVHIVTELCPGGDLQRFVEVGLAGGHWQFLIGQVAGSA